MTRCENRKIFRNTKYVDNDLSDRLAVLAIGIENAYIEMDVHDYTAEDCIEKAFELLKIEYAENINKFEWQIGLCRCKYCDPKDARTDSVEIIK